MRSRLPRASPSNSSVVECRSVICGRVGSRVAGMMAEGGRDVYALSRKPAVLPDNVRPLAADLSDAASLDYLLEGLTKAGMT